MKLLVLMAILAVASCQRFPGRRRGRVNITATPPLTLAQRIPDFLTGAVDEGRRFATDLLPNLPPSTRVVVTQGIHPDLVKTSSQQEENLLEEEFASFKLQFNKVYPSVEEELRRKEIFIENRKKVARFNQDYSFSRHRFVLKINPLADLLTHEFNSLYNGFGRSVNSVSGAESRGTAYAKAASTFLPSANVGLPDSVDWRERGAVTSVKNQLSCASCFAFSASGAVEGHHFRKTGDLVDLSPQNLLDCTKEEEYGNLGCQGGYVHASFDYIKDNPGIDIFGAYPYEARDAECRFTYDSVGANVTGYIELPSGDEYALANAVATQGPVSVAIDASQDTFQFYSEGVYFDENCKSAADDVNHAVLVVGYGSEPDGRKWWLVKNSYGPEWGNGGFIKMARDVNNHCGIATNGYYPLV